MIDASINYLHLVAVAREWGQRAGAPPEMVLRRICEWAVVGAFPEGALVNSAGLTLPPYHLYMSARAMTECSVFAHGIRIGARTIYDPNWGVDVVARTIVTARDLHTFCERTNTLPPDALLSRLDRLKHRLVPKKGLVPPPCPNAEATVIQHLDREDALGALENLRRVVRSARGEPDRFRFQPDADHPVDVHWWSESWERDHKRARECMARYRDPWLQQALIEVERDWKSLLSSIAVRSEPEADGSSADTVRMRIRRGQRAVVFEGTELSVPDVPLKVLCLLAERAGRYVSNHEIERHLWGDSLSKVRRDTRDVIRDLRGSIAAGGLDGLEVRELVQSRTNQGYRLNLVREQIAIED
jgi:DNA-binding winged helix-turn-helix (wHTH) protein